MSTSDEVDTPVTPEGGSPKDGAEAGAASGEAASPAGSASAAPAEEPAFEPAPKPARKRKPKQEKPQEAAPEEKPSRGGPSPFSEEELAAAAEGPPGDMELDELDAADIEESAAEEFAPFDKLVQKSKRLSPEKVGTVLTSVLFVSDKPLALEQLYEATGIDREIIVKALQKLQGTYREGISGLVLYEVADGWQFRTDPGSAEYVRRFLKVKPQRLTRAAVETLAIIAYRQPVTRPEVEDIRGVDSGAVIKALLDRRLIKIVGKKEEVGRPILYGTTTEFLEFFALKDLSALPTLREFHELSQEHQEIVEKETGEKPRPAGVVAELAEPEFQKKLDEQNQDSEAALAELEQAISHADQSSKATAAILGSQQQKPQDPGEEGQNSV